MANRPPIRHPHRGRLTHNEQMWLQFGWDKRWDDAFVSEADYADAWAHHRNELLRGCPPGRRPMGWWHVEARIPYPGYSDERRFMFEHNLLEPAEREALLRTWREDFERGRGSDVPAELWAEWTAQHPGPPPAA